MNNEAAWTDSALETLQLEALERLLHVESGAATSEDVAAFLAWRSASQVNDKAFRVALEFRELAAATESAFRAPPRPADVLPFVARAKLSRRSVLTGALAASVAGGFFVLGRRLDIVPDPQRLAADYSTGTGERRRIELAQGVAVTLNTRTRVALRRDLAIPVVELLAGEALFEATTAPVTMLAGEGRGAGQGVRFNARRDGDEVCVSCLDGAMTVTWRDDRRALRTGEELRYDDRVLGAVSREAHLTDRAAWQDGLIVFRDKPMRDVVREINRYRSGEVLVVGDRLPSRLLSGTFSTDKTDAFFSQVEVGLGARVMRLPGNVVILS